MNIYWRNADHNFVAPVVIESFGARFQSTHAPNTSLLVVYGCTIESDSSGGELQEGEWRSLAAIPHSRYAALTIRLLLSMSAIVFSRSSADMVAGSKPSADLVISVDCSAQRSGRYAFK